MVTGSGGEMATGRGGTRSLGAGQKSPGGEGHGHREGEKTATGSENSRGRRRHGHRREKHRYRWGPASPVPPSGRSPLHARPRAGQALPPAAELRERRRHRGLHPPPRTPGFPPPRPAGTGELLDGEAVEDLEGGVELERLAAALAHEADLRGAGGRARPLHRFSAAPAPPWPRTGNDASTGGGGYGPSRGIVHRARHSPPTPG